MSKFISLFKFQFKSMYALDLKNIDGSYNAKTLKNIGLGILLVIMLIPSVLLLYAGILAVASALYSINQTGAFLFLMIMVSSMSVVVFSLTNIFSLLFSGRDMDMLLTLPIKARNIVCSKMILVLISEYVLSIPLMMMCLIAYSTIVQTNFLFWIYAILITLFVPIIPISIVTAIVVLVIRIFARKVNVQRVQMVFTACFFVIAFTIGMFASASMNSSVAIEEGEMNVIISEMYANNEYLIDSMSNIYFPSNLATTALFDVGSVTSLASLLAFIACSLFVAFLSVILIEKVYLKSVMQGLSVGRERKAKKITDKSYKKQKSKAVAICLYDFRVLMRTPVFVFNTLFIIILVPLMLVAPIFFEGRGEQMNEMFASLLLISAPFIPLAINFLVALASVTSSSFSREGRAYFTTQVVPCEGKDLLLGRIMLQTIVNLALAVLLALVVLIVGGSNIFQSLIIVITSVVMGIPISIIGLVIDFKKPKIDWDNPAMAMKQNFNVLKALSISALYLIIYGFGTFLLMLTLDNYMLVNGILTILSAVLTFVLAKYFIKCVENKFY